MKKGNLQKLFGKLVRCKLKQRSEICVGQDPGALAMRLGAAGPGWATSGSSSAIVSGLAPIVCGLEIP